MAELALYSITVFNDGRRVRSIIIDLITCRLKLFVYRNTIIAIFLLVVRYTTGKTLGLAGIS